LHRRSVVIAERGRKKKMSVPLVKSTIFYSFNNNQSINSQEARLEGANQNARNDKATELVKCRV
jgi:hypothetical protein